MKVILIISLIVIASIAGILILDNLDNSPEETTLPNGTGDKEGNTRNNQQSQESSTEENNVEKTLNEGDSDSGAEEDSQVECRTQHIQYSLKNFQEEITCLENDLGKCTKLSAICSVNIYNLDVNSTEDFEIEYSLIETSGETLDSISIQKNIKVETPEKFEANFTIIDSNGIDEISKCNIAIKTIPQEEICN